MTYSSASTSVSADQIIDALHWRYATKVFDPEKRIPQQIWSALEESLVLAPSSYGLQPWKFVIVEDIDVRERLVAASWNQRQIVDASHLVVFAVRDKLGESDVDRLIARTAEVRGVATTSLERFRKMLLSTVGDPGAGISQLEWNARQAYIALGGFMTTAALLGIDTCPMEGLDPAKYDEILGLDKLGYRTVCACPAGYRLESDKYASAPKIRFPMDEVIMRM